MWKEIVYGFVSTGFVNLLATIGVDGEEIIRSGFIFAMCITFAVTCFIRLMLASAKAERYGEDSSTDWCSLGLFSLGAFVATLLSLWVVL